MKKFISKVLVGAMALTMIAGVAPAEEVNAANTEYYIFAGAQVSWNITVGFDNDDFEDGDGIVVVAPEGKLSKHEIETTAKNTWNTVNAGEDVDFSLSDLGSGAKISYLITAWNADDSVQTKEDFDGTSKDLAAQVNDEGAPSFTEEIFVMSVDGKELTADTNYVATADGSYSAKLHFSSQVWNDWCGIIVKVEKGGASSSDSSSGSGSSSSSGSASTGTSDKAAKTGDATGIVALSALAVLSFAGVVVLKKRNA